MPKLYVFEAPQGLTLMVAADESGATLPPHSAGPWKLAREIELQEGDKLIAATSEQIMAAIAQNGYFRYPPRG